MRMCIKRGVVATVHMRMNPPFPNPGYATGLACLGGGWLGTYSSVESEQPFGIRFVGIIFPWGIGDMCPCVHQSFHNTYV